MIAELTSFDKRKIRVRNKIKLRNKSEKPRIVVFRSNKNIYAQLISIGGMVTNSYSSVLLDKKELKGGSGIELAKLIGSRFAKLCIESGVKEVVFDKGAYLYSGRIKALADSCREAGLKF